MRSWSAEYIQILSCACGTPIVKLILPHDTASKQLYTMPYMGLLSGLLGNASEVDIVEVEHEIAPLLAPREKVEKAFRLIRDLFVFTTKRLILVDKQGMSGKKTEYHSLPYESISHFAIESAGHFDLDSELKIWLKGSSSPYIKKFKNNSNIVAIQATLATYMFT